MNGNMGEMRPISSIKIGRRFRKDLRDLAPLMASIRKHGLLHPIVVDETGQLVAGQRRLEACRRLEWEEIPVTRVSMEDLRAAETEENVARENFRLSEAVGVAEHFRPQVKAEAEERETLGKISLGSEKGKTQDILAAMVGMSGRTLEKAEAIVSAAKANPKLLPLVEEMDRTENVDGPYRKLKQSQDEKRRVAVKPVKGKYRTIVIDPPWDHEGMSIAARGRPEYAVMSLAELEALPVATWADDECHLYLWTTNNFILRAGDLVAAWGFDFKTVLTWVKPRFGLGSYFRSSTEHCLFAVKGQVPTRARNIPTHFEAPLGKHSEKPDALYDIAERSSYAPRLDAFARKQRDGWTAWGAGV